MSVEFKSTIVDACFHGKRDAVIYYEDTYQIVEGGYVGDTMSDEALALYNKIQNSHDSVRVEKGRYSGDYLQY